MKTQSIEAFADEVKRQIINEISYGLSGKLVITFHEHTPYAVWTHYIGEGDDAIYSWSETSEISR